MKLSKIVGKMLTIGGFFCSQLSLLGSPWHLKMSMTLKFHWGWVKTSFMSPKITL